MHGGVGGAAPQGVPLSRSMALTNVALQCSNSAAIWGITTVFSFRTENGRFWGEERECVKCLQCPANDPRATSATGGLASVARLGSVATNSQ